MEEMIRDAKSPNYAAYDPEKQMTEVGHEMLGSCRPRTCMWNSWRAKKLNRKFSIKLDWHNRQLQLKVPQLIWSCSLPHVGSRPTAPSSRLTVYRASLTTHGPSCSLHSSRLLTDVVAAQREAGELSKQKKLAQTELEQLQQQVAEASGVSHEVQHQLQATQAEHARLVADLRYAFCLFLSKFPPTVCAATLLCCMLAAAFKQTATVSTFISAPNPFVPASIQAMAHCWQA